MSESAPPSQPPPAASTSTPTDKPAKVKGTPKPPKEKGPVVDKKAEKAARRAQKISSRPAGPDDGASSSAPGQGQDRPPAAGQGQGGPRGGKQGNNAAGGAAAGLPASGSNPSSVGGAANLGSNNPNNRPTAQQSAKGAAPAQASEPAPPAGPTPHLIVSHLPGPKPSNSAAATIKGDVHPAIIKLGLQLREGKIRGANARLIAGLMGLKQVITSYTTPPSTTLPRDLTTHLSPQIAHLTQARAMPVGLGNAIRWLKYEISIIAIDEAEADSKELLAAKIDEYIRERVTLADEVIVEFAKQKIKDGDVVLTYARSSVVEKVLVQAHKEMRSRGESFSVIVVDSRPLLEGKSLLLSLCSHSIPCTYALLPSLPSVLPSASLVLLGTNALLSNGALYSRAGTASVAMLATSEAVPVVVCCETYKFGERIQLDAVVANEMGKPEALLDIPETHPMSKKAKEEKVPEALQLINLLYDLTPPAYVTAVCTEYGLIPPSSVPSVLSRNAQ